MATIMDGKKTAGEIKEKIKEEVKQLKEKYNINPCLVVVLVGENHPSELYVLNKEKTCEEIGVDLKVYRLLTATQEGLSNLIEKLNETEAVHGVLVQLPLPANIDHYKILNTIHYYKDVDGLTDANIAKLYRGEDCLEPCTPKGILTLLDFYKIPAEGKDVVILGRGDTVGHPLSLMMSSKKRNATVTLCHSKTTNLEDKIKMADIVVSAMRDSPEYINGDMVKEGVVVIDAAITKKDGKTVGNVHYNSVKEKASYITPVPGGVGPMTIAMLLQNTLMATKYQLKIQDAH